VSLILSMTMECLYLSRDYMIIHQFLAANSNSNSISIECTTSVFGCFSLTAG